MASAGSPRLNDHPREEVPPLLRVAQVRSLSAEQAARSLPVRLEGVVTAMPGYRNSFFVQDGTAGISVDRTDKAEVRVGDRVRLIGTSAPGLFAPIVMASFVEVIGKSRPPPAPRMTLGDLFGGMQDSQWIELRGVVHSARMSDLFGRPALLLVLALDGGSVNLLIQDFSAIDRDRIVDSVVRVRGVCASSGNEKRQFVGSVLLVPHRDDLSVERVAPEDPFAQAAKPLQDVLRFGEWQHRVKVAGVVTYQLPGEAIYLQENNDGIRVQSQSREIVAPGMRVEAVGFPAMAEYAPELRDGLFRITGQGTPVVPVRVNAGDVITMRDGANRAAHDQQLVSIEGELIEDHIQADRHEWILQRGNTLFQAQLMLSAATGKMRAIANGSHLLLTGICTIQVGSTLNPISFTILLRSPQDIVVLQRGPWWTPNRALLLVAALAGLTILVLIWVALLRNRVERQTRAIRESEGRFRYLSEHDGLTGLLNRSTILQVFDRQLVLGSRQNKSLTVILADIDHFKQINDVHGHLAGDAALRRFAEAASGSIRPYDSIGRYGGEEFLLLLVGIESAELEERLRALHRRISNLGVLYKQGEFRITCSLGVAFVSEENAGDAMQSRDNVLAAADQALYRAKEAGRNQIVLHGGPEPGRTASGKVAGANERG
jgi:diguanylate cyclase (GGDEF)-like protein